MPHLILGDKLCNRQQPVASGTGVVTECDTWFVNSSLGGQDARKSNPKRVGVKSPWNAQDAMKVAIWAQSCQPLLNEHVRLFAVEHILA